MLRNPTPNQFKQVPFMENEAVKFEYVFLEPRGGNSDGFNIVAKLYKDAEAYTEQTVSRVVEIGFLTIDIKGNGDDLYQGMHDLAKIHWTDFIICTTPR